MPDGRLLLVDDDRLILATLSQGLRASGYEVFEADAGEPALELARSQDLDLAVLDMRMPEMSGVDVARWLRENTHVPFMFLSAYGESEVVQEAIAEGALTYLVKPVDVGQLVPAIEAALQRSADLRELRQTEQQLNTALQGSRYTSMAVGLVMERKGVGEKEAFELLRGHARNQRRKLAEVAREMVQAAGLLNLSDEGDKTEPPHKLAGNRR